MKIVTAVVNNVDFIEIQYHSLKKYFKGDWEFIVFNDAKEFPDFTNGGDISIKNKITNQCFHLNILCIDIPNEHHKYMKVASQRTANSMNYILEYQKENPDKYLLLDSDMFLVDYFDINKYAQYDCAVVLQSRNEFKTNYIWNGLYYFDMVKLKNIGVLNWDCKKGSDTGGMTEEWLQLQMQGKEMPNTDAIRWTNKTYHTDTVYFIKHLWSGSWNLSELPQGLKDNKALLEFLMNDRRNENGKFFCEIYDNVFLHYRAGGNWRGEGIALHEELTQKLKSALMTE